MDSLKLMWMGRSQDQKREELQRHSAVIAMGFTGGLLHCFQGVADPTTLEELAFYGALVLAEDLGIN
jgi:hypothetical protein